MKRLDLTDPNKKHSEKLGGKLAFSQGLKRKGMTSGMTEIDRKMLRLLLETEGSIPTHEISQHLGIPLSTVRRRRKRLETNYLLKHYSLDPMKFGFRLIDLLIYTGGGEQLRSARNS